MIGISVFAGLEVSLADNLAYIKRANLLGINHLFTSLHVKHATSRTMDEFLSILTLADSLNMEVMVDISPLYMKKIDIDTINISALRLDFGFSDQEIVTLSQQKRFRIQLNASTINQEWASRLIALGLDISQVDACHNYYPRKNTGLSLLFISDHNQFFKSLGLRTVAFVPSFYRPRGNLFEGLPSVEKHRYLPSFIAAQELFNKQTDLVIVGDAMASDQELYHLTQIDHSDTLFLWLTPVDDLDKRYYDLLQQPFTVRLDNAEFVIRTDESRSWVDHHQWKIAPFNAVKRPAYCLTIDNDHYLQYKGDLQITKQNYNADSRVNVIGYLDQSALLVDHLKPHDKFKFIIKN